MSGQLEVVPVAGKDGRYGVRADGLGLLITQHPGDTPDVLRGDAARHDQKAAAYRLLADHLDGLGQ